MSLLLHVVAVVVVVVVVAAAVVVAVVVVVIIVVFDVATPTDELKWQPTCYFLLGSQIN